MESPPLTEQDPLNNKAEQKQAGNMELTRQNSSMARVRVIALREHYQTPAIGTSLIIYLILNTIMFFVGVTTTKDCPIKPIIPIYLAVAGGLGIITKLLPIINLKWLKMAIIDRIAYALFIVEFIWMILGSVWIYSIYEPPYTPMTDQPHCNKTAYLLSFWLLTLNYIFLLLIITIPCFIFCCFCICACCCSPNEDN